MTFAIASASTPPSAATPRRKILRESFQGESYLVPRHRNPTAGLAILSSRRARPRQEIAEHRHVQLQDVVVGRRRERGIARDRAVEHPPSAFHLAGGQKLLDPGSGHARTSSPRTSHCASSSLSYAARCADLGSVPSTAPFGSFWLASGRAGPTLWRS